MRSLRLRFYFEAVLCGLLLLGNIGVAVAAGNDDDGGKIQQKAPQSCSRPAQCASDGMMCEQRHQCGRCPVPCAVRALLVLLVFCHLLLAGWIYTDIRRRGEGHGVFIILALLAGFPAAVVYALVRIGDKK